MNDNLLGRLTRFHVFGNWLGRTNNQSHELVVDYVAGRLLTASTIDGKQTSGAPTDFLTTTGESGAELLERLLAPPTTSELRYGAIRESLACAASTARIGFQETRAWDSLSDYILVDGLGSCGVVRFLWNGCVAALTSHNPWRQFDVVSAIAGAPDKHRATLKQVSHLPLLAESVRQLGISSIFWSDGEQIEGGEPWPTLYAYGGELLAREILDDASWLTEAPEYWALEPEAASVITTIARQRCDRSGLITVSKEDIERILPGGAPHRAVGVQMLSDLGVDCA